MYRYTPTQDWFSHNIASWTALFPLIQSKRPRVLEVGSWEGRSAVFLLNSICKNGGEIVCIDHFDLLQTVAGQERYSKINQNLALTGQKYRILPQFSVPALMEVLSEETADDTMLDGELVWRLARKGAIIIFDDYHWDKEPEDSMHHPKRGIDAFLTLHQGEYERLTDESDYQVVLRKLTDMRIGFLLGTKVEDGVINEAMEYGINVALTVDSAYVMGAADKCKLEQILVGHGDRVTLRFLDLPHDGLAKEMGPVWAKLDMFDILPVERVLYLDADVLVRKSISALRDTDLNGRNVAAVPDVGHPMGHDGIERRPYFSAGVILIDLAGARVNICALKQLGKSMKNAKYCDQDALNAHFANDWVSLDLKWNAQGLGTYARHSSDDRKGLCLETMADPHVVHFTGPVHPTLVEILNPYVQPPTAKPWGYIGSPGHPYQEEWWVSLRKTAWKEVKSSDEWNNIVEDQKKAAIDVATCNFIRAVDKMSI
ncbi:hypothetical protein CVT25_006187 [Psilocybe cyanescens]|uniref:Glycosyltransferase family 8 protein n=1 Tax=Psilocybe cyanescens TaxID=93625 RepID=A0A409X782_PSICY|nr:hypothetical protein CVT25_006187 [Psilocybe cyanescens]